MRGEVTDTPTAQTTPEVDATTLAWLQQEFPDWDIEVTRTDTGVGILRPLWIARCDGHHPQSELSPAKLHTRLSEYLERERQRRALMN